MIIFINKKWTIIYVNVVTIKQVYCIILIVIVQAKNI
jgi:hypothetical protein